LIYLEYEAYKQRFRESQRIFNDLLLEKERLFTAALPGAIRYDKDRVQSSITSTPLESYVIALDEKEIDTKLADLRRLLSDQERLVRLKERELKASNDLDDKIYVSKVIYHYSSSYTSKRIYMSKSQINRRFDKINRNIENMRRNAPL